MKSSIDAALRYYRLPPLAADLVRGQATVIAAALLPAAHVAKAATLTKADENAGELEHVTSDFTAATRLAKSRLFSRRPHGF